MKYKCLKSVLFQYILCYGSTNAVEVRKTAEKNFNTSYVTVQHFILCYYYAVIMNFNTSYVTVQLISVMFNAFSVLIFQYILCYGSTEPTQFG